MSSQLQALLSEPLLLGLIWSIFALGVFISFRILSIADMSVEGVFPFAAVLAIWALKAGWNPFLALLLAIGAGMAAGALNGVMGRYLKINPLLAGIILMTALFSLTVVVSNGNISLEDGATTLFTPFEDLFSGISSVYWKNFCGDLLLLALVTMVLFVFVYWFFGTEIGAAIRASGKNEQLARAEGLNVHVYILLGLAISSGLVACAGALYGMRQSFATINLGKGTLIIGLATIFLGEIALPKMSFKAHLLSILIGGYLYWLIMSALELLPNYNANYRYLIQALFITLVMLVPTFKKNVVGLFRKGKEVSHA
jgi:putative ABC transport system permease protein